MVAPPLAVSGRQLIADPLYGGRALFLPCSWHEEETLGSVPGLDHAAQRGAGLVPPGARFFRPAVIRSFRLTGAEVCGRGCVIGRAASSPPAWSRLAANAVAGATQSVRPGAERGGGGLGSASVGAKAHSGQRRCVKGRRLTWALQLTATGGRTTDRGTVLAAGRVAMALSVSARVGS